MNHYFTNNSVNDKPLTFNVYLFNKKYTFNSNQGVFSKNKIDYGTNFLLNSLEIEKETKVLDIGSGIGIMGIIIKDNYPHLNVTLSDVNKRALALAHENAILNKVDIKIIESNLFDNINDKFDLIISNPPIRAGKKVTYKLYLDAYDFLNENGSLWLVVRKNQGAKTVVDYLITIYQEAMIIDKKNGYYIIRAIK